MAAPSVTWTFTNGTTSDATQVNTNYTNLINAMTDGTADFAIGSLSVAGNTTLNGNVTLGNATADDITITGNIAASITFKNNATYNIGAATSGPLSVYLGNGTKSTRIMAGTVGTSWTLTLPNDVPAITGKTAIFNTSGTMEFRYPDKFTAAKTGDYTATGDETIIPCTPSANMIITLPAASTASGKRLIIYRTDNDLTKIVTVDGNAAETINGATTYILYTQFESVTIYCDGSNWIKENAYTKTPWVSAGVTTIGATTSAPTKGSTIVVDRLLWRRDGTDLIGRIEYAHTGTTGTAAGTGDYLFTAVPTGLTIDTNFVTVYATVEGPGTLASMLNCVGAAMYNDSLSLYGAVAVYDTTKVRIFGTSATAEGCVSATRGAMTTSGGYYCIEYRVPITGFNP